MQFQHFRKHVLIDGKALGSFPLRNNVHMSSGKLFLQHIAPLFGDAVIADQKHPVGADVFPCF